MSKKIYIDPGHGGDSIGATYKGRVEQDDTLRLAKRVRDFLKPYDVEVKLSREGNTNPEIILRANEANDWGADYFASLHRNAIGPNEAKGAEAWVYSKVSPTGETYKKAERVLDGLCKATGFVNRGVKRGAPSYSDFGVNSLTQMDSCLYEVGFIDSDEDNKTFDSKFDAMAQAIAQGLAEAVDAELKDAPKPESKTLYRVQVGAFYDKKNAEAYAAKARAEGFDAFVAVAGDVNGDGKVTAADARDALRQAVGLEG